MMASVFYNSIQKAISDNKYVHVLPCATEIEC